MFIIIIIMVHLTQTQFFSPLVFFTNTETMLVISIFCNNSAEGYHSMDRITQAYTQTCWLYTIILLVKKEEERKTLRTYRHSRVENGSHGGKSSVPLCHGLLQGTEPLQRLTHHSHLQDEPICEVYCPKGQQIFMFGKGTCGMQLVSSPLQNILPAQGTCCASLYSFSPPPPPPHTHTESIE